MGNKEIIEELREFCESNGYKWHGAYSGRYMYGAKCAAFSVDQYESTLDAIVCLCDSLHDAGYQCVNDLLGSVCTDSLGMDTIIYFPNVEMDEENEDDEE